MNINIQDMVLDRGDQSVIFGYRVDGLRSKVDQFGIDKLNPTVTSDYSYDAYGRLTELKHSAGKIILSDNLYVLDDFDRLITEVRDSQARQISYDVTNQVASVAGIKDEAYTYDQNGNRLANTTDTGNRLISDGVYDYVYDAEGNRIERKSISSGEITTYQWDYRNRLTGVQIGSKSIAYSYDSQDRRIAKFVDGALVERYGHDGTNLAVVLDAAGQVSNRYLYGSSIDEVLADQTPTTLNWALADRLGTVDLIVDAQGGVIDRVTFDSFGNKVSESAPEKSFRFGFTGRELDPETGLYYYRARYYDPLVGRFISVDSIGFQAGDTNLYRYVFNSPTLATDPTGHEWWDELGQNLGNAWNGAGNALQSAWNTTQDVAGRVADGAGYWAETFQPVTDDLSDRARGAIDFVARYSTVGVAVNAISTTANIVGSVVNAIHKDWQDAGRDTENIGEQALFAADRVIAGFANVVSFGLTTKYREERYGSWIKKQHQGALYNTGQVAGVGASVALGFLTPGFAAAQGATQVVTWGGRAAQGYTLLSAGVGSYNTTTKIVNGEVDWSNPLSYLEIAASYAPAIGFAAKAGSQGLLKTQIGQEGLKATSELLDSVSKSRIVEIGKNAALNASTKLVNKAIDRIIETPVWQNPYSQNTIRKALYAGEEGLEILERKIIGNTKISDEIYDRLFVHRIKFESNISDHLSTATYGFNQKVGVIGAHSLDAFQEAIATNGIKIIKSVDHPTNPGIKTIYYGYPKKMKDPKIISSEFKEAKTPKTIYDTNYISDNEIVKYGQIASAKAYNKIQIQRFEQQLLPLKDQVRVANNNSGNIDYQIYFDLQTGNNITNYHPVIPGLPNKSVN